MRINDVPDYMLEEPYINMDEYEDEEEEYNVFEPDGYDLYIDELIMNGDFE